MSEVKVGSLIVEIPKWDMRTQLRHQKTVLPLVTRPITSAVAMSDEGTEQSIMMAAILEGVLKSLAESDIEALAPALLEQCTYRNEHGVKKPLTFDDFEKNGLTIIHLYQVIIAVIKENYGPLLKDGLQDLMGQLMGGTE